MTGLCRVVTFYSYKGGTGRTMAMANVAWILAAAGCRVLTIDWDLEAPGLHRFFGPALSDPAQSHSDGLIDFLHRYLVEATHPARSDMESVADGPWYDGYTNLMRFGQPVDTGFPKGRLDMVGAGRQNAAYSRRVNTFDWRAFYERFQGRAFLDAVFARLRASYDYILIDSRTGVSDTAGICTVHLPDALVVLFTMNRQSIEGASSVAADARSQREAGLSIYPVPTRVEEAEVDRLQAARSLAQARFASVVPEAAAASDYLVSHEIRGVAYYVYEEQLAAIVEAGRPPILLSAYERLTALISGGAVQRLVRLPRDLLDQLRERFQSGGQRLPMKDSREPSARSGTHDLYLSYARVDNDIARRFARELAHVATLFARWDVPPGQPLLPSIEENIRSSRTVVVLITHSFGTDEEQRLECATAQEKGLKVFPVVLDGAIVPAWLRHVQVIDARRRDLVTAAARVREAMLALTSDEKTLGERLTLVLADRRSALAQSRRYRSFAIGLSVVTLSVALMAVVQLRKSGRSLRTSRVEAQAKARKAEDAARTTDALAIRAAAALNACEGAVDSMAVAVARATATRWPASCEQQKATVVNLVFEATRDNATRRAAMLGKLDTDCSSTEFADACELAPLVSRGLGSTPCVAETSADAATREIVDPLVVLNRSSPTCQFLDAALRSAERDFIDARMMPGRARDADGQLGDIVTFPVCRGSGSSVVVWESTLRHGKDMCEVVRVVREDDGRLGRPTDMVLRCSRAFSVDEDRWLAFETLEEVIGDCLTEANGWWTHTLPGETVFNRSGATGVPRWVVHLARDADRLQVAVPLALMTSGDARIP